MREFMCILTQLVCLVLAAASLGNAMKKDSTRFTMVTFGVFSLLFIILSLVVGRA